MSIFGPSNFRHLLDHRVAPPMWTVTPVPREEYKPARAECVCEEPCRYCKCEDTP